MNCKSILTHAERECMLANALRAMLEQPNEHTRAWAEAALARYEYDMAYERYARNWPDSEALEGRR